MTLGYYDIKFNIVITKRLVCIKSQKKNPYAIIMNFDFS